VIEDKPSVTAEGVAAMRYMSSLETDPAIRGPDPMSRRFLGWKFHLLAGPLRAISRPLYDRITPGTYGSIVARTRFFDDSVKTAIAAGVKQIAVVGAGYDTRAWRFEALLREKGVRFFEVDHPATQKRKLERLGGTKPDLLTLAPANLMHTPLERALDDAGFDRRAQTLFLWEGCTMYLDDAAITKTLNTMVSMGRGNHITFDYIVRGTIDGSRAVYGGAEISAWVKRRGEPLTWGLEPDEVPAFLGRFKLKLERMMSPDDAEREYLTRSDGRLSMRASGYSWFARTVAAQ
jgi:methyltransferase (TIGR00027 family)